MAPAAPRFYDAWESRGPAARAAFRRRALAGYIAYARRACRFYRDRLAGFDPDADEPLAAVPPLDSAELRANLPPLSDALVARGAPNCTVFQSGGTTGMPKTSLFTHEELEALYPLNARGFHAVGLAREDRVANLWAVGGLYMTFIHMNRLLQAYGCTNFPFSNHTPAEFILGVARRFKINCFTGVSSAVLGALRQMRRLGARDLRVEKVYFGAEHLYEADARELREDYGVRALAAPGYGTVDTWYIGYQCARCPLGVFHAHDDQGHFEIVDEEEGRACPAGKAGMLYVTAFARRATPIVRYRVGDRALWLKEHCPCGRTTPLFRLLGRGDDVLRVGYDSVDYADVQKVAARVPGLSGTLQMLKTRAGGKDRLSLRIEAQAPRGRHKALRERFARLLLRDRPSLDGLIRKGAVRPLRVEIVKPGALPRNPRTGKLVRVVDALLRDRSS